MPTTDTAGVVIELPNGITYEQHGHHTLDMTVSKSASQSDLLEDHKQYQALLDFEQFKMTNPEQKFSSRLPNGGLQKVEEVGLKKQRSFAFGPKKGMSQVEFGEKFTMSYLMNEWVKNNKNQNEAVDAELISVGEQTKDLVLGYDITYAEELIKILTKGFEITTTEGPGSPCARDGLALFANNHKGAGDTVFSNLIENAVDYSDVEDGRAKLQLALNQLKNMKFDNGKKIRQPKSEGYKLFCSRIRETYWLEVTNNGSTKAGIGPNGEKENTFLFNNNLVQVIALDLLGDLDVSGNMIGNDDMWFVSNPAIMKKIGGLKCASLYPPRVKTWENNDTDEINTSIRAIIGTGHYDAEYGIVGCKGE